MATNYLPRPDHYWPDYYWPLAPTRIPTDEVWFVLLITRASSVDAHIERTAERPAFITRSASWDVER